MCVRACSWQMHREAERQAKALAQAEAEAGSLQAAPGLNSVSRALAEAHAMKEGANGDVVERLLEAVLIDYS